jgi:acyl dehydratase
MTMPLTIDQATPGATFTAIVVENLTRTQIVQYAGTSGDYNPIHTDELFARKVAGYPGVFAHGMLTMGMTGRMLTDLVGDDRLLTFGGRFTSQVWPGDDLTVTATVKETGSVDGRPLVDLTVSTVNQDGTEVFSGYARARLDS